ncbi:hypothetical protein NliqN6_4448 [Naganishia liquefaciens]|uniref:Thiamine pyrophosphokinase n=1 Tax=Naganishia liquefaciens TaxID=104408 RepID=A0A8H3YHY4_9TREE|nr:hypothetical protein NliqN6_4448 [Naganishia liquefaciens]
MTDSASVHNWTCNGIFGPAGDSPSFALIVLNQPVTRPDILQRLWQNARVKICADGGGNRLHDTLQHLKGGLEGKSQGIVDLRDAFLPDVIKGDLDSLRPDVQEFYAAKGVQIIKDGDEYSTDLQKCIQHVEEMESSQEDDWIPIVIYGGLSGRLDQTTAVLSLLHKLRIRSVSTSKHIREQSKPNTAVETHDRSIPGSVKLPTGEELYISYDADEEEETGRKKARGVGRRDIRVVNDDCIAWALDSGTHEIAIDHSQYGQTCGILPLGVQESRVSTQGLKWDFDWLTSFDTQISTSNHLLPENPSVVVKTSRPVYWTMEIR